VTLDRSPIKFFERLQHRRRPDAGIKRRIDMSTDLFSGIQDLALSVLGLIGDDIIRIIARLEETARDIDDAVTSLREDDLPEDVERWIVVARDMERNLLLHARALRRELGVVIEEPKPTEPHDYLSCWPDIGND
jgi:hypothetical protein